MNLFLPLLLALSILLTAASSHANEAEPDEPAPAPVEPHSASDASLKSDSAEPGMAEPITLLNNTIAPGTFRTLHWSPGLSMTSLNTPVPVLVAHGAAPGPTMCMTAALHGDELNGIEIVRRVLHQIEPDDLKGTIIGMPIVNLDGFRRASRYMSDRRDLNRYFPGNPIGSYASRVAHSLFHKVILHCDYLVDIHTGSFLRTNLPQLRGDLKNPMILEFSRHFGGMGVLHHRGGSGTLRRAAADSGIPAITMETGGPHSLDQESVSHGVKGMKNVLHNLGMYKTVRLWLIPQPVFYQSTWVRSNQGGIMLSKVVLDEKVKKGQLLGRVIDPITNTSSDIISPLNGIVLGKALDQVVSPGFATFHIGIIATEEQLAKPIPAEVKDPELESDEGEPITSPPLAPGESGELVEPFQDMES
ncbi:MAG: succinylglutamate desuccinylase/aspartoacylase family protein [Ketobacter sp.]|nr:succinylglutamate desuccinylase/aspartoacylase family protein [Ketobacter sp.]